MAVVDKNASIPYAVFRDFYVPVHNTFFGQAADYNPKVGDKFIVSYPKCGTTWMQHIVYLLHNRGRPAEDHGKVLSAIPFVEQDGFPNGDRPYLALKYHLPFRLIPYSNKAKYIYVARNPKDACVSYYHFLKPLPRYHIKSFDEFFEAFLSGQIPYGHIIDHIQEWYEKRNLPNVFFTTYESLSNKTEETILDIAEFLGFHELPENIIQDVVNHSSFKFMKNLVDGDFMKQYLRSSTGYNGNENRCLSGDLEPRMMRKGVTGDWKNYFSEEQSKRMDECIRTRNANLIKIWED
ncbi:Estrogen sulfotransferase, testis isoform, partial [Stegodyphus mimosarum]